jgi:hypothetical protein
MRRFVRKSADAAIVSLRSAFRVTAAMPIARRHVGRRPAAPRSVRPADVIAGALKGASIIVTISARTVPA